MNTNKLVIPALALACLGIGACSSGGSSHRYTTVRETERVYRDSDEVCHETTVRESRPNNDAAVIGATVAGAVVGGAIGNNVSHSDAVTAGGAVAGAVAGNQIAKNNTRERVASRETVCHER